VLVTGGAGFLGFHLASALASAGDDVVIADNFVRGRLDAELASLAERSNVRLATADLTNPASYAALGDGYDEVYHLAAIVGVQPVLARPYEVLRVNAAATMHVVDWMARGGGARLLFCSTSEAYAWTQTFHPLPIPTPEDVPLAVSDVSNARATYAASKIFGEMLVTHGAAAAQIPFVIVRPHNVYGPRMGYDHVIPELYGRAASGQRPLVVYSATHRRAFCYVDDAVRAFVAAMRTRAAVGGTFNVGTDRAEVTIAELATRLLHVAGIDAELAPQSAAHDPIARRCPDLTRARRVLGYEPCVGLDEGLRRTLAWYAEARRPARVEVAP
jgi:UDP-glucose 4-epimerase/UDP-glucuronate decarboxylase